MRPLTFRQFLLVGREQWIVQHNFLTQTYIRFFGPLGVHTRIRNTHVINAIRQLKLPPRARILDVGCGHAYATFWLARNYPEYEFLAIDIDPVVINQDKIIAQHLGLRNIKFIQADVSNFEIEKIGYFDLIFSIDLLEHIEDDLGLIRTLYKVLNPCGYLVLHLPRRHQEHRRIFRAFNSHTTPDHVRDEYTVDEIWELLSLSNFRIKYFGYRFSLWGELSFELNNLFWEHKRLRILMALLTHPLCIWLAYMDTLCRPSEGNSLLVIATPSNP